MSGVACVPSDGRRDGILGLAAYLGVNVATGRQYGEMWFRKWYIDSASIRRRGTRWILEKS